MTFRLPTLDEVNAAFAAQEAENRRKFLALRAGAARPDQRESAVELARDLPLASGSPVVEVGRVPLRPVLESKPNPVKPEAYCKYCGKMFKAKTLAGAKLTKSRHEKKEHAGESATA